MIKITFDEQLPPDTLLIIGRQKPHETTEEWLNRCAVIKNIGNDLPKEEKERK